MIKLNRYLRDLGIDEKNFYFRKCEGDDRYKPDEDTGIPQTHTWEMSGVLAMIIYTYLMQYKETVNGCCHPAFLTKEKWEEILDKMIQGFASIIKDEESKNAIKKQKRALDLFRKYFYCLWW